MSAFDVSFLIPARNEKKYLCDCVDSIQQYAPAEITYEILIADNYSSDGTFWLATELDSQHENLRAYQCDGNVGAVRNFLASASKGHTLVFLDADTLLTPEWSERFMEVYQCDNYRIVSGSVVEPPESDDVVTTAWFTPLANQKRGYVNGAHMIIRKDRFEHIGGFDEDLVSGEDVDFCRRARLAGMSIVNDMGLVVLHQRTPKTVKDFFRRERWHAAGDYESPVRMLRSRPALLGMVYIWMIGATLFLPWAAALLLLIPVVMSFYKFHGLAIRQRINNILLSAVYLVARGVPSMGYPR